MTLGPSHEGSSWNWPWLSQLLGLKAPAQEAEQDHSTSVTPCPQQTASDSLVPLACGTLNSFSNAQWW